MLYRTSKNVFENDFFSWKHFKPHPHAYLIFLYIISNSSVRLQQKDLYTRLHNVKLHEAVSSFKIQYSKWYKNYEIWIKGVKNKVNNFEHSLWIIYSQLATTWTWNQRHFSLFWNTNHLTKFTRFSFYKNGVFSFHDEYP